MVLHPCLWLRRGGMSTLCLFWWQQEPISIRPKQWVTKRCIPWLVIVILLGEGRCRAAIPQDCHCTSKSMLSCDTSDGSHLPVSQVDGASPLFIASQGGHAHVAKILLQNGAWVNQARTVCWGKRTPTCPPNHTHTGCRAFTNRTLVLSSV